MRFPPAAGFRSEWLFSILTVAFLLVIPHLTPKQAFVAATLLVVAYAVLFRGGRFLTLFLTATFIAVAAGGIVYFVGR